MHVPNALAQLVQHTGGLQRRVAGFHEIFITRYLSGIYGQKQGYKPLSGGFRGQLMEQCPTSRADVALDITTDAKDRSVCSLL